jgi:hypothetical protein
MARLESDREDLLREATALIERAELAVAAYDEPIVCGFRRDGSVSLFFGGDPVYQFNTGAQLRRAFVAGRIHKAEQGRIVAFSRERSATQVSLVRDELSGDESAALLATMRDHLSRLREALKLGSCVIQGEVPGGADVTGRIRRWLEALPAMIEIAVRPNVG